MQRTVAEPMETLQLETTSGPDGVLRLRAPTHRARGPASVAGSPVAEEAIDWIDFRDVGKDTWEGTDTREDVNRRRDEWAR